MPARRTHFATKNKTAERRSLAGPLVLLSNTPARSSGYFASETSFRHRKNRKVEATIGSGFHDAIRQAWADVAYFQTSDSHISYTEGNIHHCLFPETLVLLYNASAYHSATLPVRCAFATDAAMLLIRVFVMLPGKFCCILAGEIYSFDLYEAKYTTTCSPNYTCCYQKIWTLDSITASPLRYFYGTASRGKYTMTCSPNYMCCYQTLWKMNSSSASPMTLLARVG
jgi:hypothetical protein